MVRVPRDLLGQQFGELLVTSLAPSVPRRGHGTEAMWWCRCRCGRELTVRAGFLLNGRTTSCGREIHGPSVPNEYDTAHSRLYARRGRASEHTCVECGRAAQQWSLNVHDADDPRVGATPGGYLYSLDTSLYVPRCARCHRYVDGLARAHHERDHGHPSTADPTRSTTRPTTSKPTKTTLVETLFDLAG
jgi:hypothetical protein